MEQIEIFASALIPSDEIVTNTGQVKGLPKNPRFIRTNRFDALKKSIQENPEFLGGREILVFKHKSTYVVIGGNMRFKACQELGIEQIPCKIIPSTYTAKQLRAFTIKDNVSFGEVDWESIANEWDLQEVKDFGVEIYADTDMDFSFTDTGSDTDEYEDDVDEDGLNEEDNSIGSTQHTCPHCNETFYE
jgi:hypothetical protein